MKLTRDMAGVTRALSPLDGNDKNDANGDKDDRTSLPKFYDYTYEYLKKLGIKEI